MPRPFHTARWGRRLSSPLAAANRLADTPDLVDVELVDLDFLLTKDKVEEEDDIKQAR